MGIVTFPDARFSSPIELPGSNGPGLINQIDGVSVNRGQSVVTIQGFTYVFLTTGGDGNERISVWSDNPALFLSTAFDIKEDLVKTGGGAHLVTARGRAPKAFTDGTRLYLSYEQFDTTDFIQERFAICPDPTIDLLSPTGWFHLDLTTTVSSASSFMIIPLDGAFGAITEIISPGSLHVSDGWVVSTWHALTGALQEANVALGKIGESTWRETYQFDEPTSAVAVRQPIVFFDPEGFIHLFIRFSQAAKVYHARSARVRHLDFFDDVDLAIDISGSETGPGYSAQSMLSLNADLWDSIAGPGQTFGTVCITPDGLYGFAAGHFDFDVGESNVVIYNIFRAFDATRGTTWFRMGGQISPSPPALDIIFKGAHDNILNRGTILGANEDLLLTRDIDSPNTALAKEVLFRDVPSDDAVGPNIGRQLAQAHYNIRAVANSQPRLDSAGFFMFRALTKGGTKQIVFDHFNNSGRREGSVMATFGTGTGAPRPLGDIHTIWMSNPEAIRPVVFGETSAGGGAQGRYWITFFGGTPAVANEGGPTLRGNLDLIQAYTEDLE